MEGWNGEIEGRRQKSEIGSEEGELGAFGTCTRSEFSIKLQIIRGACRCRCGKPRLTGQVVAPDGATFQMSACARMSHSTR